MNSRINPYQNAYYANINSLGNDASLKETIINQLGETPLEKDENIDKIDISDVTNNEEAVVEENAEKVKKDMFKTLQYDREMLLDMLESSKEASDAMAESMDDLSKAMTIARRIMKGDRVPMKDRKFLAEKFPDLFKLAETFKTYSKKPKKHKSLVEDEEEASATSIEETSSEDISIAASGETASEGGDVSADSSDGASSE